MNIYLECFSCFFKQIVETAKIAGASPETTRELLNELGKSIPSISMDITPTEVSPYVYGLIERYTGNTDIYKTLKKKSNQLALELYPNLEIDTAKSANPLLTSLRLAVAGNVIDYGVPSSFDIEKEIEECFHKEFTIFDFELLTTDIKKGKNILYILDNAGEIVFDMIFIKELLKLKKEIVCAVREKPIINDVTLEDAAYIGLDKIVKVISSGSPIPGTIPKKCSDEFQQYYHNADIVISKGQGNYETLSNEKRPIYFIFKAKCQVVARHVGCNLGDIILMRKN
ncbi:Uncharacterized conserved protein UCP006593 [Candidatus Omnitrophus magneticus]|uniref:Uncharacterized conserved protein UCP006593 n=1 Tax=Candidatus Omnitrophus magneticus TaxID=1609969 RepID=A0A0F0CPS9_9BACT|nr:Uncharacterized conserved protein UCP006593 [Candidatus Omnitrophus magneticus]